MNTFPFAMAGFDLDGTLVDSVHDLGSSINHALGLISRAPVPEDATRTLIGGGSRLMLERALNITGGALPAEEFDPLYASMIDYYADHIAVETRPYPGCLAALDELARRGVALSVVTNKPEHLAVRLLDELGMSDRFACILGGDSLPRKKPEPHQIFEAIARSGKGGPFAMMGDSSFDVRAAKNANVASVVFSFGYWDMPVEEMDADVVLHHWDDLIPALAALETA